MLWRGGNNGSDFFSVTLRKYAGVQKSYRPHFFSLQPGMECVLAVVIGDYVVHVEAEIRSVDVNAELVTLMETRRAKVKPTLKRIKQWLHIAAITETEE
jgi:hypothetical protein